jgi:hypothetical protein
MLLGKSAGVWLGCESVKRTARDARGLGERSMRVARIARCWNFKRDSDRHYCSRDNARKNHSPPPPARFERRRGLWVAGASAVPRPF